MSPASVPHPKFPNWPNPWPQDCLELQIRHDGPACHVAFACGGLAWGRDEQGHIRCVDHGGPPGPLVCRACSRPLPVSCCSAECAREQLCEPCAGWSMLLVAQGRFLADFERALEAALPSGSLAP